MLSSYNLTFVTDTGINGGPVIGFDMGAPVISYPVLTGNYIGIVGKTGTSVIPEPGTLTLIALGLVTAAAAKRIRR